MKNIFPKMDNILRFFTFLKLAAISLSHALAIMTLLHLYWTPYPLQALPWQHLLVLWIVIAILIVLLDKISYLIYRFKNKKYGHPGVLLKFNSNNHDLSLWQTLPTYDQLLDQKNTADNGIPRCWCGSVNIRDWGLAGIADHQRVHVCCRCNYAIYRSER